MVALAEDCKVFGHGNRFEHSYFVAVYGVCSRVGDLAENRHFEIHEFYGHKSVGEHLLFGESLGYMFLQLPAAQARSFDFAEDREVDITFVVNHISEQVIAISGTFGSCLGG